LIAEDQAQTGIGFFKWCFHPFDYGTS